MNKVPEPEELAGSMLAWIVAHRHFRHLKTRLFELLCHFHANNTASGFKRNGFEDTAAEKPEVTVDVPNREPEDQFHYATVNYADPDAIPRIRSSDLVAIHQVDIGPECGKQAMNFTNVVLAIAVRVEDQVFPGILKTGNEGGSISKIPFVMDYTQIRQLGREPIQKFPSIVLTAIIDDNHFEVFRHFAHFHGRSADDSFDGVLVIVCREECGYRNHFQSGLIVPQPCRGKYKRLRRLSLERGTLQVSLFPWESPSASVKATRALLFLKLLVNDVEVPAGAAASALQVVLLEFVRQFQIRHGLFSGFAGCH